jgi:5,10-methylene-tetrahydrofolate dehydrogenase/methenyl tetrahydrofolate cyclohydrolase
MTTERNPDYKYRSLLGTEIGKKREVGLEMRALYLNTQFGVIPRLEILSNNEAHLPSQKYMNMKANVGRRLGFTVNTSFATSSDELLEKIHGFNIDPTVHGVMVQLPLRDNEAPDGVVNTIKAEKDVDGLGRTPAFDPATPAAILELMHGHGLDYRRSPVALIGRGRLVGAPLYKRMIENGAHNVDVIDIDTLPEERAAILDHALIVVSAVGKKVLDVSSFSDYEAPKIIIDAGTAGEGDKVVGDVTDDLRLRAPEHWYMTETTGGVGPLTIRELLSNVATAAEMWTDSSSL